MAFNSNENVVKTFGGFSSNKDTRGGATTIPSAVIGIVKNNVDPARSGKLQVYLVRQDSALDPDNPAGWKTVNYMSPFFGYTATTSSVSDDGKFVGNPNSYGMWMTPPDINTEVICVFLNGDPSQGYYIGSLPNPGISQMVPAIGSSSSIIANAGEASGYGGATTLPVSEINNANPAHSQNPNLINQPRTVHSYQAAILNKQGLIRDPDRGTISSSSTRESPSQVFGISTPGRPIYKGGYTNDTIKDAINNSSTPDDKFKIIGRLGGHTFVMDDGDVTGKDQLMRLRTGTGHMIMMNDKAQTLFIIHANGKSYIELGKEGTIDMYAMNSVNIRTQGDLNLHADNNVNIKATKSVNISGENLATESLKQTTSFVGTTYNGYVKGNYTLKTEGKMSTETTGEFGIKNKNAAIVLDGKNVKLNSGNPTLVPDTVNQIPIVQHPDTLYSSSVGWAAAPGKLSSIVSRAPAHSPWSYANQGVDVNINPDSSKAFPSPPSASVQAANASVPAAPISVTSPTIASTSPPMLGTSNMLDSATTRTIASQVAVNAQTDPVTGAAAVAGAGIVGNTAVIGPYGLSPQQMDDGGFIKPGASRAVQQCLDTGKSLTDSFPDAIFTGKNGITNINQFINDTASQASCLNTLLQKAQTDLTNVGVLDGTESASQTGGLIASSAVHGVTSTLNAAGLKGVDSSSVTGALNAKPPASVTAILGMIAGGNFAGSLVDKAMNAFSGLGGLDITAKFQTTAASLFATVTAKFKGFSANVPQDLSALSSAAGSNLADVASNASGLSNLPGGANAVTGIVGNVTAGVSNAISGTSQLNSIANSAATASTQLAALTNGGASSITSLATAGLPASAVNALKGAVNSFSTGSVSVKLPTVASNTVDFSSLAKQSKNLLGDDRIPPVDVG